MILKYAEFLDESLAAEVTSEPKTKAAAQARKLGLTYVGFGRYADAKGKVAYTVDDDKLVPYKSHEEIQNLYSKGDNAPSDKAEAHYSQADQFARAKKKRGREDEKIRDAKQAEIAKVNDSLVDFYKEELFDEEELDALNVYTTWGFEDINRYLYKGHDEGVDANRADETGRIIDALDSAFEDTTAPFPYTVYTGLSARYKADKIVPGNEYIFRGFISTSLDYNIASEDFADGDGVVLQIEIHKGQKAIHVDGFSDLHEMETILPRGSKIEVVSGPHPVSRDIFSEDQEAMGQIMLFHCALVEDL